MLERVGERRVVLALILAGVGISLVLAVAQPATSDIEWFRTAVRVLQHRGFSTYGALNVFSARRYSDPRVFAYWYPPGFFPWLLFAAQLPASAFATIERLVPIAANALSAWLIVGELHARDIRGIKVVIAVALIAIGPLFLAVSVVNGQIDGVAFAFVLLAARMWRVLPPSPRRAVVCGLLIGIGGLVKTVPIVFVLAFLPTVKTRREGILLVSCALGVFGLVLAPFFIGDAAGVRRALGYTGFPGGGGLTLLVEPRLAEHYLTDYNLTTTGAAAWLEAHGRWLTLGAIGLASAWLFRARPAVIDACFFLSLALLLIAPNFYEQYLLWSLPFALASGRLVFAALIEAVAFPYLWVTGALPVVGSLSGLGARADAGIEFVCVVAMLATLATALVITARSIRHGTIYHGTIFSWRRLT